jgi:hypothetical protein
MATAHAASEAQTSLLGKHGLDAEPAERVSLVGGKKAKSSDDDGKSGWQLWQEQEDRAMKARGVAYSVSVRTVLNSAFDEMDDVNEMDEAEQEQLVNSLTLEQCMERVRVIHLTAAAGKTMDRLANKVSEELVCADGRNEPGGWMVMLNTWSSTCMYPVIKKHVAKAQKMANAAAKASGSGAAADAFVTALAATQAICDQAHWHRDTEDPDECAAVAKKLSKLWAVLLTVRAVPGRLSALSVFLLKSILYGAFVWARRALNSPKRRFPARAVLGQHARSERELPAGCPLHARPDQRRLCRRRLRRLRAQVQD